MSGAWTARRFCIVAIKNFFNPQPFELHAFENRQLFDHIDLESRLLSSSYTPATDNPRYAVIGNAINEAINAPKKIKF